ncbi:outer membrane lipoprotein-sorting protein [Ulvibacter sp. MAR_2010_11]|uniref:outer membrane lipoprotein carrier protein LolA n=1 Tax=Ulvibacter sp. MAR_2010_11 TaxID=1250229 RepID=UPI000C2CA3C1|nr:outer membrane lipoprotein carrier protein LolA [Ulvibacter sp. MAR_2010_11]PKA83230.1 outer membrane lipoprotein-sorting protein [Ulvibacter sp. MAR_2010_11]
MIKVHNIIIVLSITLGIQVAFGQEKLSLTEQKALQELVTANALTTRSILSDFEQTKHISVLENDITSKGKLVFNAPDKIRWEYKTPYKNVVIFKNNRLYVDDGTKKSDIDLSSNKMFKSLNSLIVNSIKGDMFDTNQFDISYFTSDKGYLVTFIPKEKRLHKFIASFELIFSEKNGEVSQIKLIEPNEDYTVIIFRNKKLNVEVSEALFKL